MYPLFCAITLLLQHPLTRHWLPGAALALNPRAKAGIFLSFPGTARFQDRSYLTPESSSTIGAVGSSLGV